MRKLAAELESWLYEYNQMLQELERNGFTLTPQNAREGLAKLTNKLVTANVAIAEVLDSEITAGSYSIPIRIYQPEAGASLPILIFLHGGGHMSGSIEVYDTISRQLAQHTRHLVVAVDYRLAPEFPYPCGIEDAEQVVRHISDHLDALSLLHQNRISIVGDSGGGAMTATLAHRLQDHADLNLHKQVLIYPSLDYSLQQASLDENGRGYLLHKDKIAWFFSHYLQHGEDVKKVSPLHMRFTEQLPATLVITAEFCPLRDEGFEYVSKLNRAGVKNQHIHFDDMIHAFMNIQDVVPTHCKKLYQQIAGFLNDF